MVLAGFFKPQLYMRPVPAPTFFMPSAVHIFRIDRKGFILQSETSLAGAKGSLFEFCPSLTAYQTQIFSLPEGKQLTLANVHAQLGAQTSWFTVYIEHLPATLGVEHEWMVTFTDNHHARQAMHQELQEQHKEWQAAFIAKLMQSCGKRLQSVTELISFIGQTKLSTDQNKPVAMLQTNTNRLQQRYMDILDLYGSPEQKLAEEAEEVNLSNYLKQIDERWTISAKEAGLNFSVDYSGPEGLKVLTKPTSLGRIIDHLVENAIEFTKEGEVRLLVALDDSKPKGNQFYLRFEVLDTGVGITEDVVSQFQSSPPQALDHTPHETSGFGLNVVKLLLQEMGSNLQISSHPGTGSRMAFGLQMDRPLQAPQPLQVQRNLQALNLTVLVAEDNEVNRFVLGRYLSKWGTTVEFANDGKQALNMANEKHYNIILMDLDMPELDGFEATQAIRNLNDHYKHIPIIAVTAAATQEARQKAEASGLNDFVTKPFKPGYLYDILVKHLEGQFDTPLMEADLEDVSERLISLADGDGSFSRELAQLYYNSFQELSEGFLNATQEKDLARARYLMHKHSSTLEMLELHRLRKVMQDLRDMLERPEHADDARYAYLQEQFKKLCHMAVNKLSTLV